MVRFSGGVRQGRQSSEWLKFDFQTDSNWTLINEAGETAQTAAESPYTVNSIGMLARMAAHGLGVAFVPAMVAEKHAAAGRLKRLLPTKTKCFIEFLRGRMGRDTAKAA